MFSTLESNWDQSARRGRAALASFAMQALGLSLLLAIPLLTIQRPPNLQRFDQSPIIVPAPAPLPAGQRPIHSPNTNLGLQAPPTIPNTIATLSEQPVASLPDVSNLGVEGGTGTRGRGVLSSIGTSVEAAPPPASPTPLHPLQSSHCPEDNIIYLVQPPFPRLHAHDRRPATL